jgi:general nucleoside transport system ATP-binding protein
LASLMVGRKVTFQNDILQEVPLETRSASFSDSPVLELNQVKFQGNRALKGLSFSVRMGEIVGIAGVEGNGQSELLQLLLHSKDYSDHYQGQIKILGKDVAQLTTQQIKDLGVAYIPDDRLRDALLLDRPIWENFLLGIHRKAEFQSYGLIHKKSLQGALSKAIEDYDIRPKSDQICSGKLSGGNQQKWVIAREFQSSPRLLIAAQPTRGVDVGAIELIHRRILKARNEGCGVLLISSELDEIFALSDRIQVIFDGRIVASSKRGEVTEQEVGLRMGGAGAG